MAKIEFVRQSSRDSDNPQAQGERLVNLYPVPIAQGGRARFALKAVPGTTAFVSLSGVFVRAMANIPTYDDAGRPSDRLMVVVDGGLRRIDTAGLVSLIGVIPDDEETAISGNNGAVTITAAGRYFVWSGSALLEPAAGAFGAFGAVEFLGDYTILTELNDRRFCWSDLADPETLPILNFATAEARDDTILRPMAIGGNLWIFKRTSIEIWALTGGAGPAAFTRVGPVLETGLAGFRLVTKIPGGAFFVGDDGIAYLTGGTEDLQPISTPAVNVAIATGEPDACFYYEAYGHKFCVLRFKTRPALVFDLATGAWHERATGEDGAWGATGAAQAYGAWRVCGFAGAVRTLGPVFEDAGAPLVRRAISAPLGDGVTHFTVPMVQVMGQTGRADIGRDAAVMLRFSRDGGQTWGTWRTGVLGALGQYGARAVFRNCGRQRVLVAEVRVSDAADLTLWSAAEVQVA